MHITKIRTAKKTVIPRKSIFIDGSFAFGVSDDILLKFAEPLRAMQILAGYHR